MTRLLAILLTAVTACGAATDWYVRPPVITGIAANGDPIPASGVYGSQNGTSYANAWNGLKSVVWGASGVKAGDTLWIAGTHVHRSTNINFIAFQGRVNPTNGISGSPVTIRGDYPSDTASLWGVCQTEWDATAWNGPDANGVFWRTNKYEGRFQELDTGIHVLKRKTVTTWTGDEGALCWKANSQSHGTNFFKPFSGYGVTNLMVEVFGYRFHIGTNSYITFKNLECNSTLFQHTAWGSGEEDTFLPSHHITFENCDFNYDTYLQMRPGHDDWTFNGCRFYYCPYGIYSFLELKTKGAHRLTVTNCWFENTNPADFPDTDGHAIGIQGGVGHIITHNTFTNIGGSAIEFWTGTQPMRDHTVSYNYIHHVYKRSNNITSSGGIEVSGDTSLAVAGLRTGFQIYGNVIHDVGIDASGDQTFYGNGIGSNNKDAMRVFNNTIYNCINGLRAMPSGVPVKGEWFNNAVYNATNKFTLMTGSGTDSSLVVDFNLYYKPGGTVAHTFSPSVTHDVNSITNNPGWGTITDATSFIPGISSPLVDEGTTGGTTIDFRGLSIPSGAAPDIGAFEYASRRKLKIKPH